MAVANSEVVAQHDMKQHLTRYFACWDLELGVVQEHGDSLVTRWRMPATHVACCLLISVRVVGCCHGLLLFAHWLQRHDGLGECHGSFVCVETF
jgi:hypothetical protein